MRKLLLLIGVLVAGCAGTGPRHSETPPSLDGCRGEWSVALPGASEAEWQVKARTTGGDQFEGDENFEVVWMQPAADGSCDAIVGVDSEKGQEAFYRLYASRGSVSASRLTARPGDPAATPRPASPAGTLAR